MEERLKTFIRENSVLAEKGDFSHEYSPIVRFVHHQVVETARDCLKKSEDKLITRGYFYEMSENLERLLSEVSFPFNFLNKRIIIIIIDRMYVEKALVSLLSILYRLLSIVEVRIFIG